MAYKLTSIAAMQKAGFKSWVTLLFMVNCKHLSSFRLLILFYNPSLWSNLGLGPFTDIKQMKTFKSDEHLQWLPL